MNEIEKFEQERAARIAQNGANNVLKDLTQQWMEEADVQRYEYNFSWLGRPIIQYPTDMVAMQELIWQIQPDFVIETGVAHGGSLILYASLLALLDKPAKVIGIDIDIRQHNRAELESHLCFKWIDLVEGSSVDATTIATVDALVAQRPDPVCIVSLDSNHTHDHVLEELRLYSKYVTEGSYLVVFDTSVETLPGNGYPDRPWGKGNNPHTAVQAFLQETDRFVIDTSIDHKLMMTSAPQGFLRCVKT